MAAANSFDSLLKDLLARININNADGLFGAAGSGSFGADPPPKGSHSPGGNGSGSSGGGSSGNFPLTPSQTLVIIGVLSGVLTVDSVLVDRSQLVQIVLSGSLKQKTKLEHMMDHLGNLPFDEVVKAIVGRLV